MLATSVLHTTHFVCCTVCMQDHPGRPASPASNCITCVNVNTADEIAQGGGVVTLYAHDRLGHKICRGYGPTTFSELLALHCSGSVVTIWNRCEFTVISFLKATGLVLCCLICSCHMEALRPGLRPRKLSGRVVLR